VRVSDASNSGGRAKASKPDTGVLANLPRTRPQRSSPRRDAARKAAGAPAKTSAKASTQAPAAKRASVRRPPTKTKRSTGATPRKDAVPRQGFEVEGEIASGPVQPPGASELVSSAAELAGELAKAGVSGGARLLKDLFARLPPG
jgi:hypothetical protein